jgi:D-3-phosphoglycerate dehydrogenase / 2-oxoglutarate reductase
VPRVLVTPVELLRRQEPCQDVFDAAGFDIIYPPPGIVLHDELSLIEHLQGVDAMVAGIERMSANVLEQCSLRVIARFGVGYDAIDVPAATAKGIAVTITPGTNHVSVAEHTMALLLGVLRGFPARDQTVRNGTWHRQSLPRLAGKTLGLLGMGRIGREVVKRAQAFDVKIIVCETAPDPDFVSQQQLEIVDFEQLLHRSDILSLHLPCTPKTTKIINATTLAKMRAGSVLINTARGGLVDEEALADALAGGHLWGAGLDVFADEPLDISSRLLQFPNVLFAPHMGGLDCESVRAMGKLAAELVVKLYRGEAIPTDCFVNNTFQQAWHWKTGEAS